MAEGQKDFWFASNGNLRIAQTNQTSFLPLGFPFLFLTKVEDRKEK